jgi:DNA-binding HxlR family transcriptional regulator
VPTEDCKNAIMVSLHHNKMGFGEIINSLKEQFSRGTINKYLNELFRDGIIKQDTNRGPRPYYLSQKGEKLAGKLILGQVASNLATGEPAKIKAAFEDFQHIIDKALKVYPDNEGAFFSCAADFFSKAGYYKFPKTEEREG